MRDLLEVPFDAKGSFKNRKNRFLGEVEVEKTLSIEEVHIRDPGRLNEILYPGNEVLLEKAVDDDRKTDWTLLAGKVGDDWVFVNSGYHRMIAENLLEDAEISPFGEIISYKAEIMLGESRIDFLLEKDDQKIWLEIKGCTLAEDGVALFPDAPTKRGRRHVEELVGAIDQENTSCALLFLVFRSDASCFTPHKDKDPEFAKVFDEAVEAGLDVHPVKLNYDGTAVEYIREIPLCDSYG